ncbi:MAG: OpgC domain-containing protein [Acidobacteriaceae bacterium]
MQTLIRQNRDLRIDFFRGIALWSMFIDHLITGSLRAITFRQYGLCDSAELFVLLSGVSAGMVYGKAALHKGVAAARSRMLSRMLVLYRTQLIMLLFFLAEAGYLLARLKPPSFLEFYGLQGFAIQPYRSLLDGALMRYQPQYLDILPLYIVLLFLLYIGLPFQLRWPRSLLSVSAGVYVATRLFHLHLPRWAGVWYFNPLAWQVIFVIGVVAESILSRRKYWLGWDVLAALFALFSLVESHAVHLVRFVSTRLLVHVMVDEDKTNLHPLKLLSILALGWLAWRYIPAAAGWLRSRWAAPFLLLGQHSLPVFAVSVFLAMAGQAWLAVHSGFLSQVVIQGVGTLVLLGVAAGCGRNGRDTRAAISSRVLHESKAAPAAITA